MAPRSFIRTVLIVASSLVSIAALRAPAFAQGGDSGAITGYIFDQAGNPLSGIKVTAASPTQIGGKKSAYSNSEGGFRFSALQPGVFQVKAEAPKLQTIVQDNIKVGLNSAVELNLVMEVASTKVEEVKVVEKAPLVSTSTPNVKEVFDVDFVANMPHDNRDVVFQQITNYAAGAILIAALRARTVALHGPFAAGDSSWYGWVAPRLFRFGLERPSREVIEEFLGGPVSPAALLADMRRMAGAA